MKMIHALPIALAISLAPAASAQVYFASQTWPEETGAPYAITVRTSGHDIDAAKLAYPSRAAMLGIDGSCSVAVTVDSNGRAVLARVESCTSPAFERQAMRIGRSVRMSDGRTPNVLVDITWTIETGADRSEQTASLR
jgi:TonB family protein